MPTAMDCALPDTRTSPSPEGGLPDSDRPAAVGRAPGLAQVLVAIVIFGVSFAFIEASVVVYLRTVYEPIRERFLPGSLPADLLPVIRLDQLDSAGSRYVNLLKIELAREAATLVLLAGMAVAVGRNFRQGLAAFLVSFGIWDIAFYMFLKVLINWPASLLTWDLLFLLPVPWVGPVLAPVLVSISMIVSGVILLASEFGGRPLGLERAEWLAVCAGGLIVVMACCWDYRNIIAGGEPNPFHWPLFSLGEIVGIAGFARAWRRCPAVTAREPQLAPVAIVAE